MAVCLTDLLGRCPTSGENPLTPKIKTLEDYNGGFGGGVWGVPIFKSPPSGGLGAEPPVGVQGAKPPASYRLRGAWGAKPPAPNRPY